MFHDVKFSYSEWNRWQGKQIQKCRFYRRRWHLKPSYWMYFFDNTPKVTKRTYEISLISVLQVSFNYLKEQKNEYFFLYMHKVISQPQFGLQEHKSAEQAFFTTGIIIINRAFMAHQSKDHNAPKRCSHYDTRNHWYLNCKRLKCAETVHNRCNTPMTLRNLIKLPARTRGFETSRW